MKFTPSNIIIAILIGLIIALLAKSVYGDIGYTIDMFFDGVRAYLAEPDPPPEHPLRTQHMHERTSQLWRIMLQLDQDVMKGSHPRTIQADAAQVAACAAVIGVRYTETWEPGR